MYFLGYIDGPSVKNSASSTACSGEYGTLDWAQKQCDNDSECTWLHDYGCDGANWRFCKKQEIHIWMDESGKSGGCSKTKGKKINELL